MKLTKVEMYIYTYFYICIYNFRANSGFNVQSYPRGGGWRGGEKHLPGSEKDVGVSLLLPCKSTVCLVIAKLGQM